MQVVWIALDQERDLVVLALLVSRPRGGACHFDPSMSDTPIFNKRTKSRTIRARDEGTENQNDTSEEPKTVVSNFKNKNKNRTKPQQRLSFNAEDEVSPYSTLLFHYFIWFELITVPCGRRRTEERCSW